MHLQSIFTFNFLVAHDGIPIFSILLMIFPKKLLFQKYVVYTNRHIIDETASMPTTTNNMWLLRLKLLLVDFSFFRMKLHDE